MEQVIILVLLALGALVLVLPTVALVKASRARRQAAELGEQVRSLKLELAVLKRKVAEGTAPASATGPREAPTTAAAPIGPPPTIPPAPPVVPDYRITPPPIPDLAPTPADVAPRINTPQPVPQPIPPPEVDRPPAPPPVPAAQKPAFNWEQFVGVKLFAWIAGIGLLFTSIYFLKYSIEHGWIPPAARAALGFLAAAGLLVGGLWSIRRNFDTTGQSLTATGIVMLYAVTIACRLYYHFDFFGVFATGALLFLITVSAFLLAVRLEAQVVAILGLLGGFLTPIMLSTGVDNPPGLFGFIALLDLGILAVVLHRRWNYLAALAACGTVIMEIGWADKFFELAKLPTAVTVLIAFNLLFAAAVYLARRRNRASDWIAGAALIPPCVALGFSLYFSDLPAVAACAGWVLGNILVADLTLLAVCALHRSFAKLALYAGLATFGAGAV